MPVDQISCAGAEAEEAADSAPNPRSEQEGRSQCDGITSYCRSSSVPSSAGNAPEIETASSTSARSDESLRELSAISPEAPSQIEQTAAEGVDEEAAKEPAGPLSLVVQGPDGGLYVGTGGWQYQEKGADGRTDAASASGEREEQHSGYVFAPASAADPPGLEAIHLIFPDLPPRTEQVNIDIRGLEAILNPQHTSLFIRKKRCFLFLLLLGSSFYVAVFIAGLVENMGQSSNAPPGSPEESSEDGMSADLDYLAHEMLTSGNTWVALAYLVLYLSLDMIAFAGTLLDNANLLTLYILVETIITCISALEALRPFLIFRVVVIILAYQVRQGIIVTHQAMRRLHFRLTGQRLPHQYNNALEALGVPTSRLRAMAARWRPPNLFPTWAQPARPPPHPGPQPQEEPPGLASQQ